MMRVLPSHLRPQGLLSVAFLLAVALLLPKTCQAQRILRNGKIYTVNSKALEVEAVAFNAEGVIETVGTVAEVTAAHSGYTQLDLQGQLLIPGFVDAHLHAVEAGINNQICTMAANTGVEQITATFQNAASCPNNGQFGGRGWAMAAGIDISNLITQIDGGSRTPLVVLDEYFGTTPVVILDSFGHGALFNSAAATQVGYTATSNPEGGQILVNGGTMIGIATENAQHLLRNAAFPPTTENQNIAYDSLLQAIQQLNSNGITTVSDAGGFWRQAQTEAWARVLSDNRLNVRASNALYIYPDIPIATQLSDLTSRFSNGGDTARLRFNAAKIYVDGILSLATGLISTPYVFDPFSNYRGTTGSWNGMEYFGNSTYLNTVCSTLVSNGFQLHLHVTGDTGVQRALDCIIAAGRNTNGPHRLTHLFLVGASDRSRFASLNINADFQATASSLTTANINLMNSLIGTTLTSEFLPVRETYDAGATNVMTLSSDWDADTLNPLQKLQEVLNRADGRSLPNLAAALQMYTLNAAQILNMQNRVGTIETGKYADFALINQDIFSIPTSQIGSATVVATFLQGNQVFGNALPTFGSTDGGNNPCGAQLERIYNFVRDSALSGIAYVQSFFGSGGGDFDEEDVGSGDEEDFE